NRWERRDHGLYRDDYIAISFLTLWPQMRQKGCEIVLVKGRGNSDVAELMICDKAHVAVGQREKDLRVAEAGDFDHRSRAALARSRFRRGRGSGGCRGRRCIELFGQS